MYCQSCGEELGADAKFCENCGTPVDESSPSTTEAEQGTESSATGTREPVESSTSEVAGGLEPNVAGALSYLLGFITGIIFYLIEEDDEFVRFHAAQSMVVFGGLFVVSILFSFVNSILTGMLFRGSTFFVWSLISLLLSLLWFVIAVGSLILWVYLMFKAYEGETPRIPIAANIADGLV